MAKRFFYVCAGLFLLALSWHLGARNARAQVGVSNPVVGTFNNTAMVVTANGDVYSSTTGQLCSPTWFLCGNIFNGSPTPSQKESWGQLKGRYR